MKSQKFIQNMYTASLRVSVRSFGRAEMAGRRSAKEGWGRRQSFTSTDFAHKASALKRKYRGRGQYEFARKEAEQFLETEVPQNGIHTWMDNGNNAVALAQLMNYFEILPDSSLAALISEKLLRVVDDRNCDLLLRLQSAISLPLTHERGEHLIERTTAAVEDAIGDITRNGSPGSSETWNVVDLAAKIMQRAGKHSSGVVNESLAQLVMTILPQTPVSELAYLQASLLRVYSWLVRIGKADEANSLLVALVERTGEFRSYDFATLIQSCMRHHQLSPLPVQLLHRVSRVSLMYSTHASGRDVSVILACNAKIFISLETGKNGVTQRDVSEMGGKMGALLEEYEPRVLRFLDSSDKLHWTHCDDVTSIAFAYELGGRLRYSNVFAAYQTYVARHVGRFEPQQLAMAAGILRRACLLSPELASKLGERIETVLGEFSLAEISHICATFAPMSPSWMPEAKAVASRLLVPDCSSYTKLTLAMSFPDDDTLHTQINYGEITARQLVDAVSLAKGTMFEAPVMAELTTQLHAARGNFSPDDLRLLQATGRPDVIAAVDAFLAARFAEAEWTMDTLYSLPLAANILHARDSKKALEAAKAAAVSPEQFVSLVELLAGVFEVVDEKMRVFILTGGCDLLNSRNVMTGTIIKYLEAVRSSRALHPGAEWLTLFNERCAQRLSFTKTKEMVSFLSSLRTIFTDVSQQPLLQQSLAEIVSGPYALLPLPPDADVAQATVLLALLQTGAPRPPLLESSPIASEVRKAAASYPAELRDAVASMPLQNEVETKRVGRFTLRSSSRPPKVDILPDKVPEPQDINDPLEMDPFAAMPQDTQPEVQSAAPVIDNNTHTQTNADTEAQDEVSGASGIPPPSSFPDASNGSGSTEETPSPKPTSSYINLFAQASQGVDSDLHKQQKEFQQTQQQDQQQKQNEEAPVSTPVTGPNTLGTPRPPSAGLSYMKLFRPWSISNVQRNARTTTEAPLKSTENDMKEAFSMGKVPMGSAPQPRRTNLHRIDHRASSASSISQEPNRFGLDGWNSQVQQQPPPQQQQPQQQQQQQRPQQTQPSPPSFFSPQSFQPAQSTPSISGWSSLWGGAPTNASAASSGVWPSFSTAPNQMTPGSGLFAGSAAAASVGHRQSLPQQSEQTYPHQRPLQPQQAPQAQHTQTQAAEPLMPSVATPIVHKAVEPTQQTPETPLRPRMTRTTPGNHLFVDPTATSRARPVITKSNSAPRNSADENINQMYMPYAQRSEEGRTNFMKGADATKATGFNTDSSGESPNNGEQTGFWDSVVNHSIRRAQSSFAQNNSKRRKNLSEWLSTPSARGSSPASKRGQVAHGAAASSAAPGGPDKEREKERKRRGGKAAQNPAPPAKAGVKGGEKGKKKTSAATKSAAAAAASAKGSARGVAKGAAATKANTKSNAKALSKVTAKAKGKTESKKAAANRPPPVKKSTQSKKSPPAKKVTPAKKTIQAKKTNTAKQTANAKKTASAKKPAPVVVKKKTPKNAPPPKKGKGKKI